MEKIYSKVEPNLLLHIIHRFDDFDKMESFRKEIIEPDQFIQCAALNMDKGKTFRPHKHIYKERHYKKQIAQESWIILSGKVIAKFFDLDGTLLKEVILNELDASFSLTGGHTYFALEEGKYGKVRVYELKTGPYEGQEFDKEFFN